jgi:hypothetical protein
MGRQTTRSSRVFGVFFFRVPALLLDSSRPLCSFFVPSSNYDLAGALHRFSAASGATLGAGNTTDHRPSLHRSPIQTRRNPVHHSSKTVNKRGGTSWIWRWATEIRKEGAAASQKVGWLSCICWDKKSAPFLGRRILWMISAPSWAL